MEILENIFWWVLILVLVGGPLWLTIKLRPLLEDSGEDLGHKIIKKWGSKKKRQGLKDRYIKEWDDRLSKGWMDQELHDGCVKEMLDETWTKDLD